ncbi:MAG: DUF2442 domain-containing protein [Bdellovibrio sp.]|nr:DUF2442 domain-containing protein [Bdellovibrio sp.]
MNSRARKVIPLQNFKLKIEFMNGERKIFDVKPLFVYSVYKSIKDNGAFNKVFISNGIVQWPNEVDICPDRLYDDSVKL